MYTVNAGALITSAIGKVGRFQIGVTVLILLAGFQTSWHQLVILIVAPPVQNFTCSNPNITPCDPDCPSHEFNHSVWTVTIQQEWDLVCSRKYLDTMSQCIIITGIIVGNVVFGYLADRFGRRPVLVMAVTMQSIFGISAAFAPWLWLYTSLRWISNFATAGITFPVFCTILEITERQYRGWVGILCLLPYSIAIALLSLIGYLSRRWNHIHLIISLSSTVLLSYWCLLPESPRWLLISGRSEEAIQVLETGAKCNNLPTDLIRRTVEQFQSSHDAPDPKQNGNIIHLFRTKRMTLKTVILYINWFVIGFEFFTIAYYMGNIKGDLFVNIAICGLSQIPGNIIACLLAETVGRKFPLQLGYLLTGLPMLILNFIPCDRQVVWLVEITGCISMMGSAMCYATICLHSAELFPTVIRCVSMGTCAMFSRFGALLGPAIMLSNISGHWRIARYLFTSLSLIALFLTSLLPETHATKLPDTLKECERL